MNKRVISGKDTRRRHSEALKRELVERSLQPGASVAALAQEHGINANLLFNWRRLHLRAQREAGAMVDAPTLLPVAVVPDVPTAPTTAPRQSPASPRAPAGAIEIEIGGARVRLRGTVDDASLLSVLRALRELP
jgi:transposase